MTKLVVNRCFGGFSLSADAIYRYAEMKGLTLYPEKCGIGGLMDYWIVPPEERTGILPEEMFYKASEEQRKESNKRWGECMFYDRDLPRDDVLLVQIVEEMGAAANGSAADLHVVEIPDGVAWEIAEYDGNEHVAERHRTW